MCSKCIICSRTQKRITRAHSVPTIYAANPFISPRSATRSTSHSTPQSSHFVFSKENAFAICRNEFYALCLNKASSLPAATASLQLSCRSRWKKLLKCKWNTPESHLGTRVNHRKERRRKTNSGTLSRSFFYGEERFSMHLPVSETDV